MLGTGVMKDKVIGVRDSVVILPTYRPVPYLPTYRRSPVAGEGPAYRVCWQNGGEAQRQGQGQGPLADVLLRNMRG